VRIYDVSTTSDHGPLYTSLSNKQQLRSTGVLSMVFQSFNKVITGGNYGELSYWLYSTPSHEKAKSRVIWTFNPWNSKSGQCGDITEIVPLSSKRYPANKDAYLVVATSRGFFAIIDMNKFSTKSFSSKPTPTILKIWNLSQLAGLRKHVLPQGTWMGVRKIFVWAVKPQVLDASSTTCTTTTLVVDIAVITNAGWVITLNFDIVNNTQFETPRARVLHRSPKVIQCDSTQTIFFENPNAKASVPYFASVYGTLDQGASWMVVTKTKPIYEILPDCDKRILSQSIGSGGLIFSEEKNDQPDGLSVIHRNWGEQFTIPIQGKVKHLSIHPGNEWIVVAYLDLRTGEKSIKLMNLRNKNHRKRLKCREKGN
jgi:hypothetical protein